MNQSKRLIGVDIARGIALIGMFLVHGFFIEVDENSGLLPNILSTLTEWSRNQASILFFILSGVALSLISRAGSLSAEPAILRRRGVVLILTGLLLHHALWGLSILEHYGVMFLLAPWLLLCSTRILLLVTVLSLLGGKLLAYYWIKSPEGIEAVTQILEQDSIPSFFIWLTQTLNRIFLYLYPLAYWIGYFCTGMLIGRLDLQSKPIAAYLVLAGVIGAIGFYAASPNYDDKFKQTSEISSTLPANFDSDQGFDNNSDFDENSGFDDYLDFDSEKSFSETPNYYQMLFKLIMPMFNAIWMLGLMLLLPYAIQSLLYPLAALGSITLSGYLIHIFLIKDIYPILLKWQFLSKSEDIVVLILIMLIILIAVLIKHFWRTGPFEWGLKWLSGGISRKVD